MEKKGTGVKMNTKAREFKPKKKPEAPQVKEIASGSKFFKGVLPGQMAARPPPSIFPPGFNIKFENGELILPDSCPDGLRKMFMKAYDDGALDEWLMSQQFQKPKEHEEYELTEEEEALAEQFLAEQKEMEMCPYYLEGKCKYGKKCSQFHPSAIDEFSGKVEFEGDRE